MNVVHVANMVVVGAAAAIRVNEPRGIELSCKRNDAGDVVGLVLEDFPAISLVDCFTCAGASAATGAFGRGLRKFLILSFD